MSLDAEFLLDPFPWYRRMQASTPVSQSENSFSWHVFSYEDVQRVLSDYEVFSSQAFGVGNDPLDASIINMDPPRHRKLRALATQAFTPRTVAQLTPRITMLVHELLDQVISTGRMDIINDLAYPLPVIVIAELLGIPSKDYVQFKRWSDAIVGNEVGGDILAQREMGIYFSGLVEERRRKPQSDLISALLESQIDGEQLSVQELLGFCILLLVAGNITTTNLIGNAFRCFDEYPAVLEQLYIDQMLVPNALEEVLRYRSPVRCMYRSSLVETTLSGQRIPANNLIIAWIGAANRDETAFPHADTFDLARTFTRHIAFGYGIHYCLGAPLARLEARIALEAMLTRLPEIKRDRAIPLQPVTSHILHGVKNFPITFRAS